jgi:hypothetical protein
MYIGRDPSFFAVVLIGSPPHTYYTERRKIKRDVGNRGGAEAKTISSIFSVLTFTLYGLGHV